MNEDSNNSEIKSELDAKTKMQAALAKKQKGHPITNNAGSLAGSKISASQTMGFAPKIHRRKSGSA